MKMLPHFILEVANTHNGNVQVIKKIIKRFAKLRYENLGIKFQAFKFDKIALPDYAWYEAYMRFFIKKYDWKTIIKLAHKNIGKVWLDIFCVYGVEIAYENRKRIFGLKLQASVLNNTEVIKALKEMKLHDKKLLINVSGYTIEEIKEILNNFANMGFNKIILQLGFQNYPTKIEDSSLPKIDILKSLFPKKDISYADHISREDKFAKNFPLYAYLKGCSYIEKHICLAERQTKFDRFSALEYEEIEDILHEIEKVNKCFREGFLVKNEKKYLQTTLQKPILKTDLNRGQLVSKNDCIYRRTKKRGLSQLRLNSLQNRFYVLGKKVKKQTILKQKDFKKARIAVIIAGRMKSSRLKRKALLPIGGIPSLERCLENCTKMAFADKVILATSYLKEDEILKKHTLGNKVSFWQGDPEDVISRYIGACDKYGIDVVVRVTADCPFVSPEITAIQLKSHFNEGADYTTVRKAAVGTNAEIYNVEALKRIIQYLGEAKHSEFMTWYMKNNPHIFKLNVINLPSNLVRDYRLTLDYKADLDMFNSLFKKLKENHLEPNLTNIFKVLDANPNIAKTNSHLRLTYQVDKKLIRRLNAATKVRFKMGVKDDEIL